MEESDGICKIRVEGICMGASTDIQHVQGRGKKILIRGKFIDCCRACGDYVNTHPAYAMEHGFAESRL